MRLFSQKGSKLEKQIAAFWQLNVKYCKTERLQKKWNPLQSDV